MSVDRSLDDEEGGSAKKAHINEAKYSRTYNTQIRSSNKFAPARHLVMCAIARSYITHSVRAQCRIAIEQFPGEFKASLARSAIGFAFRYFSPIGSLPRVGRAARRGGVDKRLSRRT